MRFFHLSDLHIGFKLVNRDMREDQEYKIAPIYMGKDAFAGHYKNETEYIGLDQGLQPSDRIRFTEKERQLADGITLYTCNDRELVCPIDTSGMTVEENGVQYPEDFRHEQYLLIEEEGKRFLFSGCSHKGILNIARWFRPDVLIGGFHFMGVALDETGKQRLAKAAETLLTYPATYYTCHCTGTEQYGFMRTLMGERLKYIATGSLVEV